MEEGRGPQHVLEEEECYTLFFRKIFLRFQLNDFRLNLNRVLPSIIKIKLCSLSSEVLISVI